MNIALFRRICLFVSEMITDAQFKEFESETKQCHSVIIT